MNTPAFQLYAADFYMDTVGWSCEEIGLYFRLLMAEWTNGYLPNDPKRLAKICQIGAKKFHHNFKNVSPKFIQNGNGHLINVRLEKTRAQQNHYIEMQREKGKKSAIKRWGDGVTAVTDGLQPEGQPEGKSSTSSSNIEILRISCPHEQIVRSYNDILSHKLPAVKYSLWPKSQRAVHLRARWKEDPKHQSLEFWQGLFEYIRDKCPFLLGEKDWKADLGWIVNKNNFIKIREGKYERKNNS
jgi:uncharacterized protein YdaU (DUF1376 family)